MNMQNLTAQKSLVVILGIIAINLTIISAVLLGVFPTALAEKSGESARTVAVPVNADGSITVRMASETMDVNIKRIDGYSIYGGKVPVKIEDPVKIKN